MPNAIRRSRKPTASARKAKGDSPDIACNLSCTPTTARQDAGSVPGPHRLTLDALYAAVQEVRRIRARALGAGEPDAQAIPSRTGEHGDSTDSGHQPG